MQYGHDVARVNASLIMKSVIFIKNHWQKAISVFLEIILAYSSYVNGSSRSPFALLASFLEAHISRFLFVKYLLALRNQISARKKACEVFYLTPCSRSEILMVSLHPMLPFQMKKLIEQNGGLELIRKAKFTGRKGFALVAHGVVMGFSWCSLIWSLIWFHDTRTNVLWVARCMNISDLLNSILSPTSIFLASGTIPFSDHTVPFVEEQQYKHISREQAVTYHGRKKNLLN